MERHQRHRFCRVFFIPAPLQVTLHAKLQSAQEFIHGPVKYRHSGKLSHRLIIFQVHLCHPFLQEFLRLFLMISSAEFIRCISDHLCCHIIPRKLPEQLRALLRSRQIFRIPQISKETDTALHSFFL